MPKGDRRLVALALGDPPWAGKSRDQPPRRTKADALAPIRARHEELGHLHGRFITPYQRKAGIGII